MSKSITTTELKTQVGELVNRVRLTGESYIVNQRGKPVAALVPLYMLEKHEQARRDFWKAVDEFRKEFEGIPPEEVEAEVAEAIAEVRAEKRAAAAKLRDAS